MRKIALALSSFQAHRPDALSLMLLHDILVDRPIMRIANATI